MKNNKPQKINSQQELDDILKKANGNPVEFFVLLNFGLRSSKDIYLNENKDYWVYNHIDDNEEFIAHSKFMDSFIGKAIEKGALYKY